MTRDAVAKVIAAVNAPAPQQRVQATVALLGRKDRPVALDLPADVTDIEWLGLIGALLSLGDQIRAQRPQSRLVLPS